MFARFWLCYLTTIRYARAGSFYECFILRAVRLSNKLLGQGYVNELLKSSLRKFYIRNIISRILHDILEDDHIQWHPPLIRHYSNFDPFTELALITEFDFLSNSEGFPSNICNRCGMPTEDTYSFRHLVLSHFGLACVLMLRQMSPELVLFPDIWVSNIPRYFYFTLLRLLEVELPTTIRIKVNRWACEL